MSTSKHIDKICCIVLALILLLTCLFANGKQIGIEAVSTSFTYEQTLFDSSAVHTLNIVMDDWDSFLDSCENEEYVNCSVVIDNEAFKDVGIRAKGNTSLSSVAAYGNDRYSFKIEFDHYDNSKTYHGLDKLSLNNIIQDNTYMKDFLCYRMMGTFGASAPLCSFVYITVNGEDWGLYLAVEGVEESFLQRNYGNDYGELYKPDSMSMGGGRGNGNGFDMDDFSSSDKDLSHQNGNFSPDDIPQQNGNFKPDDTPQQNGNFSPDDVPQQNGNSRPGGMRQHGGNFGSGGMAMGSDDVSLIYSDDEYDSYTNVFDNAKTDITDEDKERLIASLKSLNENRNLETTVDIESVIRYFVIHNFVCNFDSYTGSMIHNYYLYEENGQLSMIPWDYNLAFGGFQNETDATALVNYPIDTPVSGGTIESRPMLAWIFNNEEYTELYHEYFETFISQYFDSGYLEELIDSVSEMIAPYVEKDPTKFCTYEEFQTGISTLKEFCLLRAESIAGQLDGSVPSTSEEQEKDSSSLINADDLSISSMGSMGNMGHQRS
ncbi:MAG: CotH kinase family protein [Eubacteriales bacterium]|nr:CotH kinase family protein [Eubacteriales bacterium]